MCLVMKRVLVTVASLVALGTIALWMLGSPPALPKQAVATSPTTSPPPSAPLAPEQAPRIDDKEEKPSDPVQQREPVPLPPPPADAIKLTRLTDLTAEQRVRFVDLYLQPALFEVDHKFKGQTSADYIKEIDPALPASRRAELLGLAEAMDTLWVGYEFECAVATIDYVRAGGAFGARDSNSVSKGRSVSLQWAPPPESGFPSRSIVDLRYTLEFDKYPRIKQMLTEFFELRRRFQATLKG